MISLQTPILGSGGTLAEALAYLSKAPTFVRTADYLPELQRLCTLTGIRFDVAFAQFCHETANGTSVRWRDNGNPAGLGIESDADNDPATLTGEEAAHLHVWALLWAMNEIHLANSVPILPVSKIADFVERWDMKYDDSNCPTVVTVADLGRRYVDATGEPQATWGWDERYAAKLVERSNAIFGGKESGQSYTTPEPSKGRDTMTELNMTKGLIPLPPFVEAYVDVSKRDTSASCRGYDMLGNRATPPKGLVLHRPQSHPMTSNEGYLDSRCCPALFDFEVLADGSAKRFAHLGDFASGWANGRVSAPYGDALKWLDFIGWDLNTVNRDWESCEVGGWFLQPGVASHEDPITEAQWAWAAQWIASRAHDYGITWDVFPIIKAENERSYITWHQEWTIGTGKICPGATLINGTSALIERARAIMKAAQLGDVTAEPKPPVYAPAVLPEWFWPSVAQSRPSDARDGALMYRTVRRNVEALKRTQRYSAPNTKAKKSGPAIEVRDKVFIERLTEVPYVDNKGQNKKRKWYVTDDGHYILASGFSPRVTIAAA